MTRQLGVAKHHIGRTCGVDDDIVDTVFVDVARVVDLPAGIHVDALADQVGAVVVGHREGGHLRRRWVINHHIGDGFAEVNLDVFTRAGDGHHLAIGHTVVVHIGRQSPLAVQHERIRCRTFDHQQVVAIGHGGEFFGRENESVGRCVGGEVKHLHIGQTGGWQQRGVDIACKSKLDGVIATTGVDGRKAHVVHGDDVVTIACHRTVGTAVWVRCRTIDVDRVSARPIDVDCAAQLVGDLELNFISHRHKGIAFLQHFVDGT